MNPQEMLKRALAAQKTAEAAPAVAAQEVVPQNPHLDDLLKYIKELEEELNKENPQLPMYMQIIHRKLIEYPELVQLLDDDQISVVYRAALRQSDTKLVKVKEAAVKKSASARLEAAKTDW